MAATPVLTIIQVPFFYIYLKHFFKTDRLCTKLQLIRIVFFGCTTFIFHWHRIPFSIISKQADSILVLMKFNDIALPA
jgi:hypothetical protein